MYRLLNSHRTEFSNGRSISGGTLGQWVRCGDISGSKDGTIC
jgi:hypothetical protein